METVSIYSAKSYKVELCSSTPKLLLCIINEGHRRRSIKIPIADPVATYCAQAGFFGSHFHISYQNPKFL